MKPQNIEVFLPMIPPAATQQEKNINWKTRQIYQNDRSKDARAKLRAHLAQRVPDDQVAPPIRMEVMWGFPEKGKHKLGDWMTTKPDLDNLQKALQDVMTELGFYKDDSHISKLNVMKFYTTKPGILIRLQTMAQTIKEEEK